MKTTAKPATPCDIKMAIPGGPEIVAHQFSEQGSGFSVAGAWMEFGGSNPSGPLLCLVSQNQGGSIQNYVGYRDGKADADVLAISVNDDKSVEVQVILPGPGSEASRSVHLTQAQLCEAVAAYVATKPQYA